MNQSDSGRDISTNTGYKVLLISMASNKGPSRAGRTVRTCTVPQNVGQATETSADTSGVIQSCVFAGMRQNTWTCAFATSSNGTQTSSLMPIHENFAADWNSVGSRIRRPDQRDDDFTESCNAAKEQCSKIGLLEDFPECTDFAAKTGVNVKSIFYEVSTTMSGARIINDKTVEQVLDKALEGNGLSIN